MIGRKGVGKSTLIQYILKLNDNEISNINDNEYFVENKSKRVKYLRLVEFRGIGYDKSNNPKTISQKAIDFIKKRNESKNYNDFIHCIWYCISEKRFEGLEEKVYQELKKVYKDSDIPIILIYTNAIDKAMAQGMEEYIRSQKIDATFVKVLAKCVILENSEKRIDEFGENDLLNLTLNKCTEALGGKMINIMVNKISEDIKDTMIKRNKTNENDLKDNIIEEFIKYYNKLKDDQSFIDYIIDILGKKLRIFYDKNIYNSSLNIIINSDIIKKIIDYIHQYKAKSKNMIKSISISKANLFIDYQATKEKEFGKNIIIENKRDLKGFIETNRTFLKQNLYYISQKDLINYIIQNFCINYFCEYRKCLDEFIEELLNAEKRDKMINELLIEFFSSKLQDFAIKNNIKFKLEKKNEDIKNFEYDLPNKNQINDEVLIKAIENENSIDLDNNELDKNGNEKEKRYYDEENESWFPICKKKLNYLNNSEPLNNFLNKVEYQDNYFLIKSFDHPFNKLKEFMKKDLENYFSLKKIPFIRNLDIQYNKNILDGTKIPIKNILQNEDASTLYHNKIKNQFEELKNNINFVSIDYLTVIVVGKSGVGKSTLTNSLLKLEGEKIAPTFIGRIGTKKMKLYKNKKVSFLRIIDTRGIEFDKNFGPKKILEKTKEIINIQKSNKKIPCNENDENENEGNEKKYNNYISCIWYCVSNNGIDPQEIEIIKGLKEGQDSLPIIVVYTNALDSEKIKKVKNLIQEKFTDIPFISVLAKPVVNVQGIFGLEKLLNETLNLCKKAVKGEMFKTIKELIIKKIEDFFRKENEVIKSNVNNEIVSKFIKDYNIIRDDKNFVNYIYSLLEIVFIGFMNNNKGKK